MYYCCIIAANPNNFQTMHNFSLLCTKVLNGSTELISQQVGSTLYVPVQMQPLGLQVLWLKKAQCQTEIQTHSKRGIYTLLPLYFVRTLPCVHIHDCINSAYKRKQFLSYSKLMCCLQ